METNYRSFLRSGTVFCTLRTVGRGCDAEHLPVRTKAGFRPGSAFCVPAHVLGKWHLRFTNHILRQSVAPNCFNKTHCIVETSWAQPFVTANVLAASEWRAAAKWTYFILEFLLIKCCSLLTLWPCFI